MSREFWASIGTGIALAGLMIALFSMQSSEHARIRTELRGDMNADHAQISEGAAAAHAQIRADMNAAHTEIRADIREIRTYLMGAPPAPVITPTPNPDRTGVEK